MRLSLQTVTHMRTLTHTHTHTELLFYTQYNQNKNKISDMLPVINTHFKNTIYYPLLLPEIQKTLDVVILISAS